MLARGPLGRLGLEGDHRGVGLVLAAVEVLDVVDQAAVVLEDLLEAARLRPLDRVVSGTVHVAGDRVVLDCVDDRLGPGALVTHDELDALVEERHLAQAGGDGLEVVVGVLEDVLRGVPGHRRAGALAGLHRADLLEVGIGDAELEGLAPQVAAVPDLRDQARGERVDHRDADAVEAAGDLVAAAAELAAGVEHRQGHRERGHVLARGRVGRDAATVVLDPDTAVGLERQHDPGRVAGECLVDAVVHDLPEQVVQSALAGGADVHARALAHGLEALEHLDRGGVVLDAAVDGGRGPLLLDHLLDGRRQRLGALGLARAVGGLWIGSGTGSSVGGGRGGLVVLFAQGTAFCSSPRRRPGRST